MSTEPCARCGRSFEEERLTASGSELLCPSCLLASLGPESGGGARRADGRAESAAAASPAPKPSAPLRSDPDRPGGVVIAARSGETARKGFFRSLHAAAAEWAAGRSPWLRLALLMIMGYILIRHLAAPQIPPYNSILFKTLNLGIHELGHVVFHAFGHFMEMLGGSLFQCLVPLLVIFAFLKQRDFFAMAWCFSWLGTNLFDVATYVADARARQLTLVSPFTDAPKHDWFNILLEMNMLHHDQRIACALRVAATLSMLFFLLVGGWLVWRMWVSRSAPPGQSTDGPDTRSLRGSARDA